jgi:hypothetical protein
MGTKFTGNKSESAVPDETNAVSSGASDGIADQDCILRQLFQ